MVSTEPSWHPPHWAILEWSKVGELQNGQDSVESLANRLEAQQQQLEDWQKAVNDARSRHYFLPLGALVRMGHSLFGDRSQVILQIKDLRVVKKLENLPIH